MVLNIDETIDTVKKINSRLSTLVDLPYTDFYKPEKFIALFELPIMNADFAERADTVSDYLNGYLGCSYFNRISFLNCLCDTFEEHAQYGKLLEIDKKIIKSIQREFKGLGE